MSQLRLQFVLGADCSSRLIAWWGTGYDGFSHVDAVLSDGTLAGARSDKVGEQPAGCQIRPANYEVWKRRMVMSRPAEPQIAQVWEQFFRDRVGMPYDSGDIIGFIVGHDKSQAGHWICSAWQADALETLDLLPSLSLPLRQITPNTLAAICSATGWLIV